MNVFALINATPSPDFLKEMLQQAIYRMFNKCWPWKIMYLAVVLLLYFVASHSSALYSLCSTGYDKRNSDNFTK
jgi:hypothetical protein